ncbi:bacillithiol biosynthesis cysteine-adding enzyme BshC [Lutibacter sp. A64]|uniref:bacillithiol biosynthesis cysteine-adding enzyme BshC n=1 Tax=Lutibacter sp. A64 TaxID=2918526 RepID=UPI001F061D6C|nr:bacillithiol biosynthesis cysteine-adding enzyme BshC [Lutibacter sp. A64]UMB54790.1 bacillithiol biosynthesis cysteine-adding enzyme BshC [Lutibacter sp. A64]
MKVHHIPFQETGYFSSLIGDYLDKNSKLTQFYGNFPNLEGFKNQIALKQASFKSKSRAILAESLFKQYNKLDINDLTLNNIKLLEKDNTFTITTGHQLNIFTGPLYFLYKIVSTINLTKQLKTQFPQHNFVPVYWMATEDHDFEEINYFNFKGKKVVWDRESSGAVGRLNTKGFEDIFNVFSKQLGNSINENYIKSLFENAYLKHHNLTDATRYLVNELFGEYGLVIIDGDAIELKHEFSSIVKDELLNATSFKAVSKTSEKLAENYNIQVNPREINLFYLKDDLRERIIFEDNVYKINNTSIVFSEQDILKELTNFPDRFSPNVIMRPLYQETILPNLCYIGGGGELAYWFQLKDYFSKVATPFPILLLRNSALLITEKQLIKLGKLNVTLKEIFNKQEVLINKKVKEISDISIDFSQQKHFLQEQFLALKELAEQTDTSFIGAVNAQEKKQLNGLDTLEKRLLKAQKRKLSDVVNRIEILQNELFPNKSLEERTRNFSEIYLDLGSSLIPMLIEALQPLKLEFSVIEY